MKWNDPRKERPDKYDRVLIWLKTNGNEIVSAYYNTHPAFDEDVYETDLTYLDGRDKFYPFQIKAWTEFPLESQMEKETGHDDDMA